jgi:hypothetical protein
MSDAADRPATQPAPAPGTVEPAAPGDQLYFRAALRSDRLRSSFLTVG